MKKWSWSNKILSQIKVRFNMNIFCTNQKNEIQLRVKNIIIDIQDMHIEN